MPANLNSQQKFEAAKVSEIRGLLPSTLGSRELRDVIAADVRARAVFCARGSSAVFLSGKKTIIDAVANGDMDRVTARWQLKELLRSIGYTPEGGFPDDLSGEVPPAEAGTLQDLSSDRRTDFMIETQVKLLQGRGQQLLGSSAAELQEFPAYELVRVSERRVPRNWSDGDGGTPPIHAGQVDERARWTIAGGKLYDGRPIALKGDPVFGELGSSGNFDDALDVDYSPFAFGSGMGLRAVPRGECKRLGVTGPNGESIEEWLAMDHPLLVTTQSGLPPAQISLAKVDPAVAAEFLHSTGAVDVEGIATPAANADALLDQIEARRLAREARKAARLDASIATRQADYQERSAP